MSKGEADTKDDSEETVPNPFSQLTDQELEEYKKEVERKKLEQEKEGKPVRAVAAGPASLAGRKQTPVRRTFLPHHQTTLLLAGCSQA